MIKIIQTIILLLSTLLLASCFGGSGTQSGGLSEHDGEGFTMNIPASWIVLDESSGDLPSPSAGTIALSVSSPDIKEGFSNNLLVLKESVDPGISSEDFSKTTHLGAQNEYHTYDRKTEKSVGFLDEVSSTLYIFEARYNQNTPKLQFLQTARVCNSEAYLLTIAVSSVGDSTKYEDILRTFQCK